MSDLTLCQDTVCDLNSVFPIPRQSHKLLSHCGSWLKFCIGYKIYLNESIVLIEFLSGHALTRLCILNVCVNWHLASFMCALVHMFFCSVHLLTNSNITHTSKFILRTSYCSYTRPAQLGPIR